MNGTERTSSGRHVSGLRAPLAAGAFVLAAATAVSASAQDAGALTASVSRLEPDRDFGRRGLITRIGSRKANTQIDSIVDVAIDSWGRIVVCGAQMVPAPGAVPPSTTWVPGVARFDTHGRIDPTFGVDGVAILPLIVEGDLQLAIDRDDRPVVTGVFREPGTAQYSGGPRWSAARLSDRGALDPTFSGDGLLETSIGPSPDAFRDVRANPADGSLLVATERGLAIGLVRVTPDGALDPDYGNDGLAPTVGGNVYDFEFDGAGRALVRTTAGISRLAADGTGDPTFGVGGLAISSAGTPVSGAFEFDADGRVVVLEQGFGGRPGLYRFLPDGAPDPTFGEAGHSPLAWGVPARVQVNDLGGFAVTRGAAPRYVCASSCVTYANDLRRFRGSGVLVQTFDPAAPRRVASYVGRLAGPGTSVEVRGVAVSADGETAVVAGSTYRHTRPNENKSGLFLLRVGLTPVAAQPLPDFHVYFTKPPALVLDRFGDWALVGRLHCENSGGGDPTGVNVGFYISDDDVLDAGDTYIWYRAFRFAPGSSGSDLKLNLPSGRLDPSVVAGRRVIAVVNPDGRLAEANVADNLAVSERLP